MILPSLRVFAVALGLLAALPAPASDSDNTYGLDTCLAAALTAHPGLVTRWEVEDGTGRGFAIEVVTQVGVVWQVNCVPGSSELRGATRSTGVRDYPTLSSRAQIPEPTARETVRTYYPGRFIRMEYQITWRGGAVYNYRLITADDRQADVEVDASSGRIQRTRSEAR